MPRSNFSSAVCKWICLPGFLWIVCLPERICTGDSKRGGKNLLNRILIYGLMRGIALGWSPFNIFCLQNVSEFPIPRVYRKLSLPTWNIDTKQFSIFCLILLVCCLWFQENEKSWYVKQFRFWRNGSPGSFDPFL